MAEPGTGRSASFFATTDFDGQTGHIGLIRLLQLPMFAGLIMK